MRPSTFNQIRDQWRPALTGIASGVAACLLVLIFVPAGHYVWTNARHWVSPYLAWPHFAMILILTVLLALLALHGWRLLQRIGRSWRFGLFKDVLFVSGVFSFLACLALTANHQVLAALCGGLLLFYLVVAVKRDLTRAPRLAGEQNTDPDLPVSTAKQDSLNRRPTVDALLGILLRDQASVLALVAPFGDGKTSVLNMLEERLRKSFDDKFTVVRFSSWLPPSPEALIVTLFESIIAQFSRKFAILYVSDKVLEYARVLTGSVPHFSSIKDLFRDRSQSARVARLTNYIQRLPTRTVVLIDDVDRMGFDELELLFKAMRGISDMSNITFVCAFDREAVLETVSHEGRTRERYLEKFFPVQIPLAKTDIDSLKALFSAKLTALAIDNNFITLANKDFPKRLSDLWDKAVRNHITNLRRLKLLLNKVRTLSKPIGREVDFVDFLTLEILRDVSPQTYEVVFQNPQFFYYPDWAIETWGQRLHPLDDAAEKGMRKSFYEKHLANLPQRNVRIVRSLLAALFPLFDEFEEPLRRPVRPEDSDKRIYNPRFFRQYFVFRVPEDYLGQQEFWEFEDGVRKCTGSSSVTDMFERAYGALLDTSIKRWQFLQRVEELVLSVTADQAQGLCIGIAHMAREIPPDAFELFNGIAIVGNACRRNPEGCTKNAAAVIAEAGSDFFALKVHAYLDDPKHPERREHIQIAKVKEAVLVRLRSKFADPQRPESVFALPPDQAIPVLFGWAQLTDASDIRRYIEEEFRLRPESTKILLRWMFPTTFIINPNDFRRFVDYRALLSILGGLNKQGALLPEDQERLEKLRGLAEPPQLPDAETE